VKQPPHIQELLQQAAQQHNRRAAAAAAAAVAAAAAAGGSDAPGSSSSSSSSGDLGPWSEGVPQRVLWDGVCAFDELSAAQGCLGRFTGAGVLPLLKQLCGWPC
jgi:hypothetical protein